MRTSTRRDDRERTRSRPDDGIAPWARRRDEYFATPYGVGRLTLIGDLPFALDLPDPGRVPPPGATRGPWVGLLERYFAGEAVEFPLDVAAHCRAHGFTAFQSDVYAALATVPFGVAVSYRDLALAAGRPNAYRAAGSAMARNELPVILPCHRVVKNDGRPGFYGDDPRWKVVLLRLEGALAPGEDKVRRALAGRGRVAAGGAAPAPGDGWR